MSLAGSSTPSTPCRSSGRIARRTSWRTRSTRATGRPARPA